MKILQVITELGAGGAEKVISILAEEFGRNGHTVSVISLMGPPENPAIPNRLKAAGVRITYLNMKKRSVSAITRLRAAIKNENPDIVHSHLIHPNILCRLALIGTKIPLINTIHISERRKGKKIFFLLDRLTFHLADMCTAVSNASAEYHCNMCGLKKNVIRTVYNGINQVPAPSPARIKDFQATFHTEQYAKVIGSIGRLDYQKGYDLLIERINALDKRIPRGERWLLLILGDGINTIHISERRKGKKIFFLLDRLTFHLADMCTAVSNASAEYHCNMCGLKKNVIRTVYNGINQVPAPSPARIKDFQATFHTEQYAKVIGSIGRLDYQKGYDLLIERINALDKRIPRGERWLLLILGDGPERNTLQTLIDQQHWNNLDFRLGGFYPDAASLMDLFDVFVMPSRYEGYGLALAEAMTLGLPVVSSDADSLPELCALYHGAHYLVDMTQDTDGETLAEGIFTMANAARTSGQILQSHESMADEYLTLYRQLLERS